MGAGDAWRKERESRGMTLDQAASLLRVSRKYLHGIEECDYSGWPERVFSSGYIRAYAKLLSQDPEPVLSEYYQQLGRESGEQQHPQLKPEWLERERQRGSRRTTYGIAAAVVLAIGIVLAWYGTRTATRSVPAPPVPRPAAVPAPAPVPADNAAKAQQPPAADNAAAPAASQPATEPQGTVAAIGEVGPVKFPYQLFLEAGEKTWIMYALDNEAPVEVMLYPGDKISLQARRKILLKMGNAGGVAGTLNGKLLPPFGSSGQVKEIRLGE